MLAHAGARYDISDLCEVYGAGRQNSVGSSKECFSGGGPESAPFSRRVRGALALRSCLRPEAFPLRGLGPPRTKRVWGVASVAKSGPGELLLAVIYFRFGRTRVCITPVSLHRVKIIVFFRFFRGRTAANNRASSGIIHLFCYIFVLLFSLAYYVVGTHSRGHIVGPSPPSPLRAMVGRIQPMSTFCFLFCIATV